MAGAGYAPAGLPGFGRPAGVGAWSDRYAVALSGGVGYDAGLFAGNEMKLMIEIDKVKSFSIGHRLYKVRWQKEAIDKRFVGQVIHSKNLVKMQSGRPREETVETIVHEILHCASTVLGDNLSEKQVIRLGSMVAQALLTCS